MMWTRSSTVVKTAAGFLLAVAALVIGPLPVHAQGSQGTIHGGVYDTSGGAIAGATMTITSVERGTTRQLTTNAAGQYTAPGLLPGTYRVRAEAKGFKTEEQSNVLLEVSATVRVDLKLAPGEQTQTVTVTSAAPMINTTNATLGGAVTNQAITQLPLVTRNFLDLLQLRPGVVYVPGSEATTTSNGRREGSDVLLIEGVTQFDMATSNILINGSQKGNAVDTLPLDSIQEFSTQQEPPAEYGWRDGSIINVAVKSGTNSIHGSAYAFGRDAQATDAKLYNAAGPESKNNLTVVQPGFTLGGPAIKDKLFWFVSAEFLRQSSFSTVGVTAPTDIAGAGTKFSMVDACNDIINNQHKTINPLSAQIAGLDVTNCTVSPATTTFENLWPFNNTTNPTIFPNPATDVPSNNGLAKVDFNPNDKQHFDFLYYISRETTTAENAYQPFWNVLGVGRTNEYAGGWTYTPNSNWVNEFRVGAAPNLGSEIPADANRLPSDPYPAGYSINTGVTTSGYGLACISVSGIFGHGQGLGDCGRTGTRGPQYQLDFTDKVSYLHGNHAFKFGYEQVFVKFDDASTKNLQGAVSFRSLEDFLTGNTHNGTIIIGDNTDSYRERWYAAFVQDSWRITPRVTLTPGIRWEYIGSPHSTVNHLGTFDPNVVGGVEQVGPGLPVSTLIHPEKTNFNPRVGVAWDIFGDGKTVLRGGISDLSSFPAILAITGSSVPYAATLCTDTCVDSSGNVIANDPGIVVNNSTNPLRTSFPLSLSFGGSQLKKTWTTTCTDPSNTSTCSGPAIFPITSGTSGLVCDPSNQCSMNVSNPNFKNPKSIQWNVDLERSITNSISLDVAYVGVHGYDETNSVDLNEPAVGVGWTPSKISDCLGQLTPGSYTTNCSPDAGAIQAARPYASQFPYFQYIVQTQSGFHSNYNALQVTLNARNFHGLSFITAYTYGHALDDWTRNSQAASALANPANPQYQYGNSDFDLRNTLRFSWTYAIPGIKSPGQMLEGWQISGIWALQGGFPWAPVDPTTNDWAGNGEYALPSPNDGVWQSWNYSGPASAFNGNGAVPIPCYGQAAGCTSFASILNDSTSPSYNPGIYQACAAAAQRPYAGNTQLQQLALAALFGPNSACYIQNGGILTPPAYGTLGNATRGMFRGPMYENVDATIEKTWRVKERYAVQLRIECYNLLNQVNYLGFAGNDASSDPSGGGGTLSSSNAFGFSRSGLIGAGGSSNRQFQFGMKLTF